MNCCYWQKRKICLWVLFLGTIPLLGQAAAKNPFGLMLGSGNEIPEIQLKKVQELRAHYLRPLDVQVEEWRRTKGKCKECDKLKGSGLRLILTARYNGRGIGGKGRVPSSPPRDLSKYQEELNGILTAYGPEVLAVENEEDSPLNFYDGTKLGVWDSPEDGVDTADKYSQELQAACEVAHKLGRRCTNGGISSQGVALLTWANYLKAGRFEAACDFAKRVFYTRKNPNEGEKYCKVKSLDSIPPEARRELAYRKQLLDIYKTAKIDYINFHWYIRDAKALDEVVVFLRSTVGKPVISNEIGQWNWDDDPKYIRPLMETAVKLSLPYVIWFSTNANGVSPLIDKDGSLRPNGDAFAAFLRERYP